jgi:hypothetical protein
MYVSIGAATTSLGGFNEGRVVYISTDTNQLYALLSKQDENLNHIEEHKTPPNFQINSQ